MINKNFKILKDKKLNVDLNRDGFVKLKLLEENEILFLRTLYDKWHKKSPKAFYKSYFSENIEYKKEIENAILKLIEAKLKKYFLDFESFGAMFVVKPTGDEGHIPPHQDWSFVDEDINWSLNLWCPLIDTTGKNGNIQMLKGSHLIKKTIRGFGTPEYFKDFYPSILKNLTDVPLKAGEAVFFFHSIIHCSTYNYNNEPRICIGTSIIQKDKPLYYFNIDELNSKIKKFKVRPSFFLNYLNNSKKLLNSDALFTTEKIMTVSNKDYFNFIKIKNDE